MDRLEVEAECPHCEAVFSQVVTEMQSLLLLTPSTGREAFVISDEQV